MSTPAGMTLRRLDKDAYAGYRLNFDYESPGYYDVQADASAFRLQLVMCQRPVAKQFEDVLFSPWLEDPAAFGMFDGDLLAGVAEGSREAWNNRFRVSEMLVYPRWRGQGVGHRLMETIIGHGASLGCRMAVLETQSCNVKAIDFYRACGFSLIGLDMYCYSNHDPDVHEVRLEMGRPL